MAAAAEGAREARDAVPIRELREYGLDESFRTGAPVLGFVDRAIAAIGHPELGLAEPADPHVGRFDAGLVTLWRPVSGVIEREDDEGEEGWLARHDRQMADRIARQVRTWLDDGFTLAKNHPPRAAGPGDIKVLVRKRKDHYLI